MMHAREKSDFAIVAEKPTNKAERGGAGEDAPAKHARDTEPGKRDPGVGAHLSMRVSN
jgi:hypothetical protein